MSHYDVVVIGAGNGGLSAATYLAKAGKKVLIVEQNAVPGGCATSFVRGRFEFEASLHELCQMGTPATSSDGKIGAARKLLDSYGLEVDWVPVNESFHSVNTDKGNGFVAAMPVGVTAFVDEMERLVPGSRASMVTVMELSRMVSDGVDWLAAHDNEPSALAKVEMLLKYKDLMKIVPVTTDDMLRRIGVPDKAREIYESYWDYVAADSSKMSFAVYAFMVYTYLTQKPWIARHRSHEISMAFERRIHELGGDIWYRTKAMKIDVRDGKVKGVVLDDNRYIPCEYVLSNAMPNVVFDRMIDHDQVPERSRRSLNARQLAQSAFTIYLGLDASAEDLGLHGYDTFVRSTGDTVQQFEHARTIDTHQDYCVTIINEVIPDASPEGTCMLQFSKFYSDDVFADVEERDYYKVKDRIARETIEHFEKTFKVNIRDHIEEVEVATPATWARYLGTPRGDVYGYLPATWDGMFPRVQSGHYEDRTIAGLRFVGGHGTQMDGYSQAYLSGAEQARYALEDLKAGA